jgi:hypothetical protein
MKGCTTDQAAPKKTIFQPVGAGRNIASAVVRLENGAKRRIGLVGWIEPALTSGRRGPLQPQSIAVAGHGYK